MDPVFGMVLTFVLITGGIGGAWYYVVMKDRQRKSLKENGRPVKAKLLKFIPNGRGIGTGDKKIQGVDLFFEIQPTTGDPYQVIHREQLRITDIAKINPGAMVELRLDPSDPQKVGLPEGWLNSGK